MNASLRKAPLSRGAFSFVRDRTLPRNKQRTSIFHQLISIFAIHMLDGETANSSRGGDAKRQVSPETAALPVRDQSGGKGEIRFIGAARLDVSHPVPGGIYEQLVVQQVGPFNLSHVGSLAGPCPAERLD